MKITREEVLHVAELARLEIAVQDTDAFARHLGSILDYVELLKTVDTKNVPATSHAISIINALREDAVAPHLSLEQVMANAPDEERGGFRVPRIIGG